MRSLDGWIVSLSAAGIAAHLGSGSPLPLYAVVLLGGLPLLARILRKAWARDFGADLLAGLSIPAAMAMGQPLAAAIVVLMLSSGALLEAMATRKASSVLDALAKRSPTMAHLRGAEGISEAAIEAVAVGDELVVLPHEICPVDGVVLDGHGSMDESYLTGEPYRISKTPGSAVLSGAINGEQALVIRAGKRAVDSRYAGIMKVVESVERDRPRLRRLADRLAAVYMPLSLAWAALAWAASGDPLRFLSVLMVATPCPLIIAIPVAVIGAISLSARRGIIVKKPAVFEEIAACRTVILDKTGTLTYGKPGVDGIVCAPGVSEEEALRLAAGLERYSRHPLAAAVLAAAEERGILPPEAESVGEKPGEGLRGSVGGRAVRIFGRAKAGALPGLPPEPRAGLECLLTVDGAFAAAFHFRDAPRKESRSFLAHLAPLHGVTKLMLVSGDRESEVRYLARMVGIEHVEAQKSPEEKVAIVREETGKAKTLFVGDGVNDAPALLAATVGIAMGSNSDVTAQAAGAVILSGEIGKVDELIHIGRRMRAVALQSALGGMGLSLLGMAAAAAGWLTPVEGAVLQEIIDLAAVLNAVRVALPSGDLVDF